ncbi:hypothetical protein D1007_13954 [Hordeum vulgare]|nr:hypothetical protein D1007_13954 [Hordeum vulgare]
MSNAATGPDGQEHQGSSQPAIEQADSRTATLSLIRASVSASRAHSEMRHVRRMLAMATELLRYRPSPDHHNDWLQRIEELVATAGASTLMPFGLGNAASTYQQLQQAMLMPCMLRRGQEEEEMLGTREGPEPQETADL